MFRQFFCYWTVSVCVLLFSSSIVMSEESVRDAIKKWEEHERDVFLLRETVDKLESHLGDLVGLSNKQLTLVKSLKTDNELVHSAEEGDVCERISSSFNSTQRKYNYVEERIVTKLDEINDEQTINLKKILDKRSCHSAAPAVNLAPESFNEIIEKIDGFEKQLNQYETLQNTLQVRNEEQLKILREINILLTAHQEKFDNIELQLPNLMQDASGSQNSSLPINLVVGMLQNANKGKTN